MVRNVTLPRSINRPGKFQDEVVAYITREEGKVLDRRNEQIARRQAMKKGRKHGVRMYMPPGPGGANFQGGAPGGGAATGAGAGAGGNFAGGTGRTGATGTTKAQTNFGVTGVRSTPFGRAAGALGGSGASGATKSGTTNKPQAAVPPNIARQIQSGIPLARQPAAVQRWFQFNPGAAIGSFRRSEFGGKSVGTPSDVQNRHGFGPEGQRSMGGRFGRI